MAKYCQTRQIFKKVELMKKSINKLEQKIGYKINNIELYINAITHKSADKKITMKN